VSLPWIGVVVVLLSLVIAFVSWSLERNASAPVLESGTCP